ncbi:MAG: PVC-type heme-binding CxxCH protein, partial [Chthoniobacteraceae bacterium]
DIPDEDQAAIDRYTREFTDKLVEVALAAARDLQPARLEWGIGCVDFARNRRTPGGPVDHDLPVLVVRSLDGRPRAIWFSYACHCVTLSNNLISGDWAGFAQSEIERDFPGAIGLASIGCGADANPDTGVTGEKADVARSQGREIADEIKRLLAAPLTEITERPVMRRASIELAFDTPRTRAEWEERAQLQDAVGHHARVNLARLDRGESLPTEIAYPIQTWRFGDQLALVFLPGEVVVDYALRLKREFDRARLGVVAYANDAPCYIPSERVLREGGYEGGDAMIYYDKPQRLAPGLEAQIVAAVHAQVPATFVARRGTEGTHSLSPEESRQCFRTKSNFAVELVAAEPLVMSPVAIDWDASGRLWVCEMFDYPTGVDEQWKPGGRIRILTDTDGDGRFDHATLFLEDLPFPTGVMAWRQGALICAAPDILYAEDTDGDGRADKVEKLFSGFATDNYQARVNGLSLGLDNWIHGANGLLGGVIHGGSIQTPIAMGNRDFRMRPDTGAFEPTAGLTQHGRVRDDWGNWFGCDNSRALFHFPLPDDYVRRNPRVAAPDATVNVPGYPDANRVFPISPLHERYNDPEAAGRLTSACGLGIYRDDWLGPEFRGDAFTCEPVHNLVHREVLASDGVTFTSRRADDEAAAEFLASTDPWFRPVQARTGPDGALYVVDMARFLIEHPRWIPEARLAQIDVRAGAELGRIWRVVRRDAPLRTIRDLTKLTPVELVAALETPNGTERDRAHLELLARSDAAAVEPLSTLARESDRPEVRVQALSALDGLHALTPSSVLAALADPSSHVRTAAIRLAEQFSNDEAIRALLVSLVHDQARGVRYQLALSLGELDGAAAAAGLSALADSPDATEIYFRAAVRSSAARHPAATEKLGTVEESPLLLAPLLDDERHRLETMPSPPLASIEPYVAALAGESNPARGAEVFARACALCHRVGEIGFATAPDLGALREKPADYWLKNILDPQAAIEPRFGVHIIQMKGGRLFAGIIKSESATSLTLIQPGGLSGTILRADVEETHPVKVSLMPADLGRSIDPQEMADLISFLRGGGPK